MTVLLIGCGRMGGAMARGWTGTRRVLVHDPSADLPRGAERLAALDPAAVPADATIVLAVKPQVFGDVAPAVAPLAARGATVVSIMAGITLDGLSQALGGTRRIVRAMPNTPAAIGAGMTAAVAGEGIAPADRTDVAALFAPTGAFLWLEHEGQMDAVTALSGCGPAYFFRFAEALAQAAIDAGLPPAMATALARATFTGAGALAQADAQTPLATLREQVTSPGGVTAEGLAALDREDAIDRLARVAIDAARARSAELAGG